MTNFQYGTLIPGHTSITTAMTNQLGSNMWELTENPDEWTLYFMKRNNSKTST